MTRRRIQPLVTRASLIALLNDPVLRPHVIGRALIVLFHQQTTNEQASNHTQLNNFVGFSGADARDGSITAKYYIKHKTLLPWQIDNWMKTFRGFPRICKYHRQLNAAAEMRRAREAVGDKLMEEVNERIASRPDLARRLREPRS